MSAPYTDAILAIVGGRARGIELGKSSAEQIAAGLLGRAFISAKRSGRHEMLFSPERLQTMASELVIYGQSLWLRDNGDIKWEQRCTVSRKTGQYRIRGKPIPPERVLHFRTNVDMISGQGRSDLAIALTTQEFIRKIETNLADEIDAPRGYLIPTQGYWEPKIDDEGNVLDNDVMAAMKDMEGGLLLVPSETINMMGAGTTPSSQYEWHQRRIGFEAPEVVLKWYEAARLTALSVMGIPASLVNPVDASAMREGWRLYLFTVVDPLAKLLEAAAARCGLEIDLNFDELGASDIANRARAYGSLVDGGMSEEEAKMKTGLA